MFEVSSTTALMLYLGFALAVIFGIWLFQHFQFKRKPHLVLEQTLYKCEYCRFAYLSGSHQTITQCPQCKLFNSNFKQTK